MDAARTPNKGRKKGGQAITPRQKESKKEMWDGMLGPPPERKKTRLKSSKTEERGGARPLSRKRRKEKRGMTATTPQKDSLL